ncbi:phosphoribosylamine--glycine ligase [Plastoroseomonas arctica]|uniref:Phosphoribosylamine--glycine ligase n=1 Tax=Plastoroseomonas arctica TaxID=1509237 RepID=A0AAF1JVN7_9PROT|nr:phosphoribosylamine--glycine ligase [Plastoroseomonas arctica]MBR0654514.1 phosphoribosylamine--glycine ligase [Plastoroseomonas arctica]
MRAPVIATLVLLAACGSRTPVPAPAEPDSPDASACRAESRDNPERSRLMATRFDQNAIEVDRQIEAANLRAYRDCLRRRGAVDSGGVERVRR